MMETLEQQLESYGRNNVEKCICYRGLAVCKSSNLEYTLFIGWLHESTMPCFSFLRCIVIWVFMTMLVVVMAGKCLECGV